MTNAEQEELLIEEFVESKLSPAAIEIFHKELSDGSLEDALFLAVLYEMGDRKWVN